MAAGESLSPYDDITSDELFDSFMDVVSSVEQSFSEEDLKDKTEYENPYEDISNINGIVPPDINFDIDTKNNEPSQFSSLLPSNDPIHLPLLVKLYKEPIYEMCGDKPPIDDIGPLGDNGPIDCVKSNTYVSDLDDPVLCEDIDSSNVYDTIDNILTSNLKRDVQEKCLDSEDTIHKGNYIVCIETSNLDDFSGENSLEDISNIDTCDSISSSTVAMETESNRTVTSEYATINKDNKGIITDIYAVVNKENKTSVVCSQSTEPDERKTHDLIDNSGAPHRFDNDVKNNDTYVDISMSNNSNDCQNNRLPGKLKLVDNNCVKDDYAEIAPIYSVEVSKDNVNSPHLVVSSPPEDEYELISNIKPSISNCSSNEYTDINDIAPMSPEITFNAEQIAYGFNRSPKDPNDIYQTCIQAIERNELMSSQTPKVSSGKDKRNFFGFGKWKSSDDTSKSPTSPVPPPMLDDFRRESKLYHNCSPSNNIPVLCSGYLFKQGGTGFIPKNWRLRWFHLKKDNCLYYYKSEQDQIPIGAVILLKYQVSRVVNVNKRFCFKVSKVGARTYFFAANSEDEMRKWMGYLNEAADSSSDYTSIPECSLKNVSIAAATISDPDCHGFISKQGNIHKNWKKRYCVLKYGCLFYYEDMADKVAIGVFKLHRHTIHKSETTRYGFEAVPPVRKMRTYYFYTNTEIDTRRWIDAMRHSISSFQ